MMIKSQISKSYLRIKYSHTESVCVDMSGSKMRINAEKLTVKYNNILRTVTIRIKMTMLIRIR